MGQESTLYLLKPTNPLTRNQKYLDLVGNRVQAPSLHAKLRAEPLP